MNGTSLKKNLPFAVNSQGDAVVLFFIHNLIETEMLKLK
jgi:hypothetical protein